MSTKNDIVSFWQFCRNAIAENTFVKATLSKSILQKNNDLHIANNCKVIHLRPVSLKGVSHIQFTFRYPTRDDISNYTQESTIEFLEKTAGVYFQNLDFFTTTKQGSLLFSKKGAASFFYKNNVRETNTTEHNREKKRLLEPSSPWLAALGIANQKGEILPTQQDKWRQINKFLENILPLASDLPKQAKIADMGSGKGYLTFALYDFLKNKNGISVEVFGIERRADLVVFCNKTAKNCGFDGLKFVEADIANYEPTELDMLIALHACDTATDLAIAKGIKNGAKIIIVAPCCHKQIRREMQTKNELAPLLQHGILEERQAEILTDGIRALLLETQGYQTSVFEFISTEHTPKNVMITARFTERLPASKKKAALEKIAALKSGFGIERHFLEGLI